MKTLRWTAGSLAILIASVVLAGCGSIVVNSNAAPANSGAEAVRKRFGFRDYGHGIGQFWFGQFRIGFKWFGIERFGQFWFGIKRQRIGWFWQLRFGQLRFWEFRFGNRWFGVG